MAAAPWPPRVPAPLRAGSRIVVAAPSSGVEPRHQARLDLVLQNLRARGFVVEEGRSLRAQQQDASAPPQARAAELAALLQRDDVDAIWPPWGGELAIELLPLLPWDALVRARPKWLIGYSDTSTLLLALTLRLGWVTAHGPGLMDLVAGQDDPTTTALWSGLATAGAFTQTQSPAWQKSWGNFASDPACSYALTETTRWRCLNRPDDAVLQLQGRLIGGCIDTLMHLKGTPFGDVPGFAARCAAQGEAALVYLENAEQTPTGLLRALAGLRLAGWFDGASAVLIGRDAAALHASRDTARPVDAPARLPHDEALRRTLSDLPCPVLVDADIGHVPPQWLLLNGARAGFSWSAAAGAAITQRPGPP